MSDNGATSKEETPLQRKHDCLAECRDKKFKNHMLLKSNADLVAEHDRLKKENARLKNQLKQYDQQCINTHFKEINFWYCCEQCRSNDATTKLLMVSYDNPITPTTNTKGVVFKGSPLKAFELFGPSKGIRYTMNIVNNNEHRFDLEVITEEREEIENEIENQKTSRNKPNQAAKPTTKPLLEPNENSTTNIPKTEETSEESNSVALSQRTPARNRNCLLNQTSPLRQSRRSPKPKALLGAIPKTNLREKTKGNRSQKSVRTTKVEVPDFGSPRATPIQNDAPKTPLRKLNNYRSPRPIRTARPKGPLVEPNLIRKLRRE